MPKIKSPTKIKTKPINFERFTDTQGKHLGKLNRGVLCYAVLRHYKGKGKPKVILHEATIVAPNGYMYGGGKHFVFNARSK